MYYVCFRKVFLKYCHKTGVKGVKKGSKRGSDRDIEKEYLVKPTIRLYIIRII